MGSKTWAISTLLLRILTLLACVGCMVAFIINTFRDPLFNNGSKATFKDLKTYRFVFSTAAIRAAYSLLQLPPALYLVSTGKRLIRKEWWPELDFYGDEVISLILAMGVGAGFAVSFEVKRLFNNLFGAFAGAGVQETEAANSAYNNFFDKGIIATAILFLGFVCLAGLSVLSSFNRTKK
ncbi:hypothetical protein Tsubulata_039489 [Turnera subulata]|uniref:CASP-like protein n=1 Tax=Turnera subulata TaxID=218843 RepID=A0A9Q0J2V0_9ROSI|nr:hypothetical protein Tsubulata_039489 [Turnera subulata]